MPTQLVGPVTSVEPGRIRAVVEFDRTELLAAVMLETWGETAGEVSEMTSDETAAWATSAAIEAGMARCHRELLSERFRSSYADDPSAAAFLDVAVAAIDSIVSEPRPI